MANDASGSQSNEDLITYITVRVANGWCEHAHQVHQGDDEDAHPRQNVWGQKTKVADIDFFSSRIKSRGVQEIKK